MSNMVKCIAGSLLLATITSAFLLNRAVSEESAVVPTGEQRDESRPYCDGWTKPAFAFFITGRQHGYIEPCGCTGLDFQKGGLARRQTLHAELKAKGWPLVPIDVGNQVRRFGPQPAIKFQTTMNALRKMDYKAVGIGPDDLRLDVGELL